MSAFAAVDLGATSGRVIVGGLDGDRLRTQTIARFPNDPVRLGAHLHWNITELYRQVLFGLAAAERGAPGEIESIGVDSWAVDYGLLRGGRLLGIPFHYRDERGADGVRIVHRLIAPEELHARNGLQHLPFNTVFQLATESEVLELSDRMLLIPDLLHFWLAGADVAERTNASTTGLLSAATGEWDHELADRLGIPGRMLPPLVDPGTRLGVLRGTAADVVGRQVPVTAVGSHDTASAVVAVPSPRRDFAFISCGTWGLVGLELDEPVMTEAARAAGFTNEAGVDGRVRFLHNVMGLWVLSESLRHWHPGAPEAERAGVLERLLAEASQITGKTARIDVDDPVFLAPGDMPGRIVAWCTAHGEPVPESPAEVVRTIIESLADAFARSVAQAAALADQDVSVIHIVGGGSQNALLCQLLADRSGLSVHAGPVEATAMGNLLVQVRAAGQIAGDLEQLRRVVASSAQVTVYIPGGA